MPIIAARNGYEIDTDRGRLDLDAIHGFLKTAYWCEGIPRETVRRSIDHSLCFGLYSGNGGLAGFARAVTDHTTFAYLADVFVLPDHQGHGLGKWLVATVLAHPDLAGLRQLMLATRDAHGLYARFGFTTPQPGRLMEIRVPKAYLR